MPRPHSPTIGPRVIFTAAALAVAVVGRSAGAASLVGLYPLPATGDDYANQTDYSQFTGVQAVGGGSDPVGSIDWPYSHAIVSAGRSGGPVDLNPVGFVRSKAFATDGAEQVGYADGPATDWLSHAVCWSGTAASAVDLNPAGFDSFAYGVAAGRQVGYGSVSNTYSHALLWSGTAASVVDLNPAGFDISTALGIDGTTEVGYAATAGDPYDSHAFLWSGTAASAVDLQPASLVTSDAEGVGGGREVGCGHGTLTGGTADHALAWSGSAASVIDLNPAGYATSIATGTDGSVEVGSGTLDPDGRDRALAWTGTAASAVDLHALLPADGDWYASDADAVGPAGVVYGRAYGTYDGVAGAFAVTWSVSAVPEPAGLALLAAAVPLLARRRADTERPRSHDGSKP